MEIGDQFALSWSQHESDRTIMVKELLEKRSFVDVTIVCDDDQIDAHKVLLSAASPFFRNIFERNPQSHPLLYIRGSKKKSVKALIDFIYGGETSVPFYDLESFMKLGEDLQIKGLVDKTCDDETYDSESFQDDEDIGKIDREKDFNKDFDEIKANGKEKFQKLLEEKREIQQSGNEEKFTNDSSMIELGYHSLEYISAEEDFLKDGIKENMLAELDAKVESLLVKVDKGKWTCKECDYKSSKQHVKEHIEEHLDGYSHSCETCEKVFKKRITLRMHKSKCTKKMNSTLCNKKKAE